LLLSLRNNMNSLRWSKASYYVLLPVMAALLAGCGKKPVTEPPVRAVRTLMLAETGGVLEREFAAEVRARTESRLGFRVGGKVNRRLVELGQSVTRGQVLAQLDPQDLQLAQEAARAGLAAAEAQATQAAANYKRFVELKSQGFISAAELERHDTMNKAAQASLRQARAQAGVQGNQTSYAALTADAPGVITGVDLEPGMVVGAGMPVLTLAHDGPRDVVFSVPEDMGPTVRSLMGKPGALKARRWGTQDWVPVTLREVAAATDPLTRTYLVKADVGRAGFELGQTATVGMNAPVRAAQGVRVPVNALAERGGKSVLWVLDGKTMTVNPVEVTTKDITGNLILVSQGIQPGQEIVTAGVHVLTPGQKVRRYQAPNASAQPAAPVTPAASAATPASGAAS
jgi:membrane fusion protein, multidrug efflux system